MPSSDIDSAVAWVGDSDAPRDITSDVLAGLAACGIPTDPNGATAANPLSLVRRGLLSLVNLARYGAVAAGSPVTGAVERLRVAAAAGVFPAETAASLEAAFDLLTALRLHHQVDALRAGRPADDFIDPRALNPLARRYLRDAFRTIASIQRALENELAFGSSAV